MNKRNGMPFLWRGILGALIGSVLGISILYLFYFKRAGAALFWGSFAFLRVLPVTVIVGTLLGALAWVGAKLLRTRSLTGAVLGAIAAAIIGSIIGAIIDGQTANEFHRSIWDGFFIKYGMIAGAVTGLISGAQNHAQPE